MNYLHTGFPLLFLLCLSACGAGNTDDQPANPIGEEIPITPEQNIIDTDDDNYLDSDEIAAGSDPKDASSKPLDTDSDFISDATDTDDDGDGVPDISDVFPLDSTEIQDFDGDGIGDNEDLDDDNDKFSDYDELASNSNPQDFSSRPVDTDGDFIPDVSDLDDDGDGIVDDEDAFPLDPTENADSDGDGIGDNSDPDTELNQKITQHAEYQWQANEYLMLEDRYQESITIMTNGDKKIEWQIITYRLDDDFEIQDLNGSPLVYSNTSGVRIEQSDGSFNETFTGSNDVNSDNTAQFHFQFFRQGSRVGNTLTYLDYFRESPTCIELDTDCTPEQLMPYELIDIKAAILAEDYSQIDTIQTKVETISNDNGIETTHLLFKGISKSAGVYDFTKTTYEQVLITKESSSHHEIQRDWDNDGIIDYIYAVEQTNGARVEFVQQEIWSRANYSGDFDWREYAEYSWNNSSLGDYGQQTSEHYQKVNGQAVYTTTGLRYLSRASLSETLPANNIDKYPFHEWVSKKTHRSDALIVEELSWQHTKYDDALFKTKEHNLTVDDEIGQRVTYSVKYEHGLWLNWQYSEVGSQDVVALQDTIDQQLLTYHNNYKLVAINSIENSLHPSPSFMKDENGDKRTWYLLTNSWSQDDEMEFAEVSLPNIELALSSFNLYFLDAGSKLVDFYGVRDFPELLSFDSEKGIFKFKQAPNESSDKQFQLFLNKQDAADSLSEFENQ